MDTQATSMKMKKWWIIGLITLIGIAVAIFLAEHFLKKRIKQELQIQTTYGDTLRISKVNLGLIRGWVDINDLVIRWNLPSGDTSQESYTYLIRGEIGKIRLEGLSFSKYLFSRQIVINKLLIDSSAIDMHLLETTPDYPVERDTQSDQGLNIQVNAMEIAPSRIRYFSKKRENPVLEVQAMSLQVGAFRYPQDPGSSQYVKQLDWRAEQLRYTPSLESSDLLVALIEGDSRDSTLNFSGFRFLPKYSKEAYSRHLEHKDSRVDIAVASGKMDGIDWQSLLNRGEVRARHLQMDSCFIEVYEDSRLPVDETRYKSLYQEKLLKSPLVMAVDTTTFRNGQITYEMRPEGPEATIGYLKFLNLEATITNITNDQHRISKQPLLQAKINTEVNGESELNAYFTFDLSNPDYAYSYSGNMRGFDLREFNTILMETSRMKITEGRMQQLSYQVDANNHLSRGEMRIDYSDLKIDWQEDHNRLAALAQKVMMREQNPKNDNYRVGQIYHEREPYRSFWSCYLKSLLSGLKSTAMPNLFLPEELDAIKENK